MKLLSGLLFNPQKIQISAKQYLLLIITYVLSTADISLPAFVAQEAKEDSWISVIIGTIFALIVVNILVTLALKFPSKTIVEYACDIVGKPIGKIIGISFVFYFLQVSWSVIRELDEIFGAAFNSDAPVVIYGIVTIIVAAFAVYKGLEVIARVNEILLPIAIIILLFLATININNINLNYLLPVFYNGYIPSLKGGLLIQTWLIETVILLLLTPYVKEKEKIRKYSNIAIIVLGLSFMIGIFTITIFGPELTSKLIYPALEFVRNSSIGPYIQNLDILIMIFWLPGMFVKIALSYYLGVQCLSQVINSKSQNSLIIPTGIMILVFSSATAKTFTEYAHFLKYYLPFYASFMTIIIPVSLLIIYFVKKKV
jgi:spore germination protein KB